MAIKSIRPNEPPKKKAGKAKKNIKKSKNRIVSAVNERSKKAGEMDYTFLLLTAVLTIIGLVMLLSASTPAANIKFGKSYYFFIRQFAYSVIGFVLMYAISLIDYHKYKKYANIGILVGIVLLVLVLIPHIGIERNGSRRWLGVSPIIFQPTELVKFLIALFFASSISDKKYDLKTLEGLAKYGLWILMIVAPIMLETHLSGAIVITGIAICLLIVGGANMKYILTGGAGLLAAGAAVAVLIPSRAARLVSFWHPFEDPQGKGYQIIQSLYAIGSGGLFGRGLGDSMQKRIMTSYLPLSARNSALSALRLS